VGCDPGDAGGRRLLIRIARVVPDLATFAVDDGFAYAVPEGLDVGVGAIVRVPLGGRRIRGYVVSISEGPPEGLKEVLAVSGDLPVFDGDLLEVLRWAAVHYVAPLATLLAKAAPPNLPRAPLHRDGDPAGGDVPTRVRTRYWLGPGPWDTRIGDAVAGVVTAGGSALVMAPSLAEVRLLAEGLGTRFPGRVRVASSGLGNAEVTRVWSEAATLPGLVVVATRDAALWPIAGLGLAVVVGEGRRGLKDRATPTVDAVTVLWRRSTVERFSLILCGLVPTTDVLARAPQLTRLEPGRLWGLVELVDRREDPPGAGVIGTTIRRSLHAVLRSGGRAFVLADRRSPALRCVQCRALRLCPSCGSDPGRTAICPRCAAELGGCAGCGGGHFEAVGAGVGRLRHELAGFLGPAAVGERGDGRPVVVGTERDLAGLDQVDLAVVVDGDGPLRAPHYRAVEDGLRLLARTVAAAGTGRGRKAIIQTSDPGHPVFEALRRGDPMPVLEAEASSRSTAGLPPGGELLVVEAADAPGDAAEALRTALGNRASLHGPADHRGRVRWLVRAADLRAARVALRGVVHEWREHGARVRVDADPIDL
jgi:primosomal protein N' (replication factor Y)